MLFSIATPLRYAAKKLEWPVTGLLFVILVGFAAVASAGESDPPNIVLLYSDDAGYADFGFQMHPAADMRGLTPNIDRLAASGARCTDAYMSGAVCSPSRAGMLTGRYQQRFGHEFNIPPGYMGGGMSLSEKTVADRLGQLGYRTGIVGKWHLGYPPEYHPNRRGFDEFYGLLQGSRPYFPMKKPTPHRILQHNGRPTPESGYVTDRIGDAAVAFIRESARSGKPFFLYVSFTAPHSPLQPKPEVEEALLRIKDPRRRKYAGLVKTLDDNVGKILEVLDGLELSGKTLVVFTNDNGGQTLNGAVNTPLRGRKGMIWEGGIRVPMAFRWPGKIPQGRVVRDPVISLDFLPTFVAAAGGRVEPSWKLDGVNLLPLLTGRTDHLPERPLFWRIHGPERESAIRRGQWKLVLEDHSSSTKPQLYDLENDLGETTDVASEHPRLVESLATELAAWESQLIEPSWSPPKRANRRGRPRGRSQQAKQAGRK